MKVPSRQETSSIAGALWRHNIFSWAFSFPGARLNEPHINVLNASSVCMYVCIFMSYRKQIHIR